VKIIKITLKEVIISYNKDRPHIVCWRRREAALEISTTIAYHMAAGSSRKFSAKLRLTEAGRFSIPYWGLASRVAVYTIASRLYKQPQLARVAPPPSTPPGSDKPVQKGESYG